MRVIVPHLSPTVILVTTTFIRYFSSMQSDILVSIRYFSSVQSGGYVFVPGFNLPDY